MPAEVGRGSAPAGAGRVSVPGRRGRGLARVAGYVTALSLPLISSCAGAPLPVFLPGERVECLFEVMGEVTVEGPFGEQDDIETGAREVILEGVRLEVGRQTVGSGADAVMVRELVYELDPAVAEDGAPQIVGAEGMLLHFVDPTCMPSR